MTKTEIALLFIGALFFRFFRAFSRAFPTTRMALLACLFGRAGHTGKKASGGPLSFTDLSRFYKFVDIDLLGWGFL
jgi:hypothetical protein